MAGRICFVALLMTITLVVRIIVHASAFNYDYILITLNILINRAMQSCVIR